MSEFDDFTETPDVSPEQTVSSNPPTQPLPTKYSLAAMIFLGIITFGIYPLVKMCIMSVNINVIASRYDGKKTMFYILACLLAAITLGIFAFVWFTKFSGRIGDELKRRNLAYSFGARDFWLWGILGSLIIVGPFIYIHKLCYSMKTLSEDYNARG